MSLQQKFWLFSTRILSEQSKKTKQNKNLCSLSLSLTITLHLQQCLVTITNYTASTKKNTNLMYITAIRHHRHRMDRQAKARPPFTSVHRPALTPFQSLSLLSLPLSLCLSLSILPWRQVSAKEFGCGRRRNAQWNNHDGLSVPRQPITIKLNTMIEFQLSSLSTIGWMSTRRYIDLR